MRALREDTHADTHLAPSHWGVVGRPWLCNLGCSTLGRGGVSLGFYNPLECKQMALGLLPLENKGEMGLGKDLPSFIACPYPCLESSMVQEH